MDLQLLIEKHDTRGMLKLVQNLASQIEEAWEIAGEFAKTLRRGRAEAAKRVVVCGMGGSAIGADMMRSFAGPRLKVPLYVSRDYSIPEALLQDSLIVFSSYSGNTRETLSCFEQARGKPVVRLAITSGGRLGELCREDGIECCFIPEGFPPRAAIAYSLVCASRILHSCDLLDLEQGEFFEARELVGMLCDRYSPSEGGGEAIELARLLENRIPFVYACDGVLGAVARRWVSQFNENSKVLAHFALFPELCHNEIVGWENLEDMLSRIVVIVLQDREDHEKSRAQLKTTLEMIEPLCYKVVRYPTQGESRLSRALSLMALGDFTSVYLALLYGVDPTPVEKIAYLKARLGA